MPLFMNTKIIIPRIENQATNEKNPIKLKIVSASSRSRISYLFIGNCLYSSALKTIYYFDLDSFKIGFLGVDICLTGA